MCFLLTFVLVNYFHKSLLKNTINNFVTAEITTVSFHQRFKNNSSRFDWYSIFLFFLFDTFSSFKLLEIKYKKIIQWIIDTFFWIKIRVTYYVNNWIYTTNHKRIAVNYFWFVILSGIVGMVLATLIRLEFAYPGVGIFAGDSLQYLSLASAHGVIMVFFMIMPLLFGAFANFLLPTQLGVHDVAFPRLNSAAFWFLPGGLLMLCQLVCVDRRYQRMNCFNIREVQAILKRKFFVDLINSKDHHNLLNKTAMGLRYKIDNINSINGNIFLFYNFGIDFTSKIKLENFRNFLNIDTLSLKVFNTQSIFSYFLNFFKNSNFFHFLNFFLIESIKNNNSNSIIYFSFRNLINYFFFLLEFVIDNGFSFIDFLIINSVDVIGLLDRIWYSKFAFGYAFAFAPIILSEAFFYAILDLLTSTISGYLKIFNFKFYLLNLNISNSTYSPLLSFDFIKNLFLDFFLFYDINFTNFLNFFFLNAKQLLIPSFININAIKSINDLLIFEFKNTDHKNRNSENIIDSWEFYDNNYISFRNNDILNIDNASRLSYIYVFFYFLLVMPINLIFLIKNLFELKTYILISNEIYNLFLNWYLTFLIENNITSDLNSAVQIPFFEKLQILIYFKLKFFFINIGAFLFSGVEILNSAYEIFKTDNDFSTNTILITPIIFFYDFIITMELLIFDVRTKIIFQTLINFFNSKVSIFSNITNSPYSLNLFTYKSNYLNNNNSYYTNKYINEENSDNNRYLKFSNPIFKYDYKSGDYFPKLYYEVYPWLFNTIGNITTTVQPSSWFFSEKYTASFESIFSNFIANSLKNNNHVNIDTHLWSNSRFNNTDNFYNFFYLLSQNSLYGDLNTKFVSLTSLNQKFNKIFNTSSMQQRIYSNWRQLKFTREAWRCKLLAARHQKTLFRRYVHEDGVFWSIERNAKDLLPGWAMITPFSSRTRFTAIGKTDIGLMGVLLVLNSSIISAANFLVTYRYLSTLNNRKMRDARAFFTEGVMVASWMMLAANPMLVIGIIMLLSDRHWQTSFFDYSGGGDTVLFQHMFWFFGHPEVYIIIIPTFGFTNTMLSYYLRKRVSARASLMYSMYTIAFLGFFVWGHHMYMVGLAHTTRMLFSTLTVMISVPAATKIMHWCVTTVNSAFATELPLLFTFTFIFFFVSGGISGMCVAHTGMDVLFHDTFYVIGHFHVMLAGAGMFASFGAFYFYFPAIFGVKYSRIYAYLHYSYYLLGQLMTVIPMFWLGYAGMPRRVLDYPASMGGWHSVISAGHMLSVAGLMAFFIMIFDSLRQARAVIRNIFGISRYNIRLNFYLYEIAKLTYAQQKGLTLFKFFKLISIKLNKLNYKNYEPYETVLLSYTFANK